MRGRARREPSLDPVRWRRPGRMTLLRSAVVAGLIATAAAVMWVGPSRCGPGQAGCSPCAGLASRPGAADERRPGTVDDLRWVAATHIDSGTAAGPAESPPPDAAATPRSGPAAGLEPHAASVGECRPADIAQSAPAHGRAHPPPAATAIPGDPAMPADAIAVPPDSIAVPPGSIGVPIRLAEPTVLGLIHPGDHVDVFRVPDAGESPQAIATAALVLDVTGAEDPTSGGLLLALTPTEARRTVTASGGGYAVLIRPDG